MEGACTDRVFLERLSLRGKHGIRDHEREIEQEFLVDISVACDSRLAGSSDSLSDALDYSRFRSIAQEIVVNNSFFLIERLSEVIAMKILEDDRVAEVSVTIRKPAVYPDTVPGVSITRKRA